MSEPCPECAKRPIESEVFCLYCAGTGVVGAETPSPVRKVGSAADPPCPDCTSGWVSIACPQCNAAAPVAAPDDAAKTERAAIVTFLRARVAKRNVAATTMMDRFIATAVGSVVETIADSIEKNEHHTEEP